MEETKELKNCATCEYNVRNCCKNHDGYYIYGEAIIDEEVPCDEWAVNYNATLFKLEDRRNFY